MRDKDKIRMHHPLRTLVTGLFKIKSHFYTVNLVEIKNSNQEGYVQGLRFPFNKGKRLIGILNILRKQNN